MFFHVRVYLDRTRRNKRICILRLVSSNSGHFQFVHLLYAYLTGTCTCIRSHIILVFDAPGMLVIFQVSVRNIIEFFYIFCGHMLDVLSAKYNIVCLM